MRVLLYTMFRPVESQAGSPERVVSPEGKDAGISSIDKDPVVRSVETESVEQIELESPAQTEVGLAVRCPRH
jgi:hypothetical protein